MEAQRYRPLRQSQRLQQTFIPDDTHVVFFGKRTTREIPGLPSTDSAYLPGDVVVVPFPGTSRYSVTADDNLVNNDENPGVISSFCYLCTELASDFQGISGSQHCCETRSR